MESEIAASESTGSASGLPCERPLTTREKAAAVERSKRDAEMAELRRLRSEKSAGGLPMFGAKTSSSDEARRKREQEMEEIRRLKAGENEENRKRLSAASGPGLTTDMDEWRSKQLGAKAADRKSAMEAQSNLKSHRGVYHETKTEAALDKAAATQAQRERAAETKVKELSLGADGNPYSQPEGGVLEGGQWVAENAHLVKPGSVMFKEGSDEHIPMPEEIGKQNGKENRRDSMERQGSKVMFKDTPDEEIPVPDAHMGSGPRVSFSSKTVPILSAEDIAPKEEECTAPPKAQFTEAQAEETLPKDDGATSSEPKMETKTPHTVNAAPPVEEKVEGAPNELAQPPPAYSRVDIKFSFGLIVRSSAADGFETENLRDNETLRKCMEGTAKILHVQLPSLPDAAVKTDYSKFPDAYYDPMLEPNVISIEEDQREGEGKAKTAKGNKRTLVKASFPVFLRNGAGDGEEGRKRGARILKETKTTVFKALRAAVSGGSFLR